MEPTPKVFGKYELQKRIASGGMAEVYLAVERLPHGGERQVVIKRILPVYAEDPDFVEFFQHEARLSLQLCHPNLIQTYEFGVEHELQFLAMEYVRGQTLLATLRQASLRGRHLSLGLIVKIASDIVAGLHHAHSARDPQGGSLGLIHRDVSPHNVLVGYEGITKLADFGVARTSGQRFRTRTGVIKGKFAYLAPEQLRRGGNFDHRVDLFAVGIVLYEMLSRRPLFRGYDETDTLNRILKAKIPPVRSLRPDCPESLERVVMLALERNPDRRYSTAGDLLADLEQVAQRTGLPASISHVRAEMDLLFPDEAAKSMVAINMEDHDGPADPHDEDSQVASVLSASQGAGLAPPLAAPFEKTDPARGQAARVVRPNTPPDPTLDGFLRAAARSDGSRGSGSAAGALMPAVAESPPSLPNVGRATTASYRARGPMAAAGFATPSILNTRTLPGAGGNSPLPAPPSRLPAATPSLVSLDKVTSAPRGPVPAALSPAPDSTPGPRATSVLASLASTEDAPLELDRTRGPRRQRQTMASARPPLADRNESTRGENALLIVGVLALAAVLIGVLVTLYFR